MHIKCIDNKYLIKNNDIMYASCDKTKEIYKCYGISGNIFAIKKH
jgi:hypothetical protein